MHTGDTGTGKEPTIFDAICFALFGRKIVGQLRRQHDAKWFCKARHENFCSFWRFMYKDKRFTVERNPSYERPKLRSEGFKQRTGKCYFDTIRWASRYWRLAAVTTEIESILGINKNQFLQITWFAPRWFLRLLLANNAERSAIFRKFYGTEDMSDFKMS